jgi:vacuolar-type H+-ATPase subunit H
MLTTQSADAKSKLSDAEARAKDLSQKTGKEINSAIDKFDKTVEEKAAKAKSGISSWFGGK